MDSDGDRRFQYQEGKFWALQCLLGAALQASGIRDQPLDALIEHARQGYPATLDSEGPVGQGFNEALSAVRNWKVRSP